LLFVVSGDDLFFGVKLFAFFFFFF
jgi:hypothetical protein